MNVLDNFIHWKIAKDIYTLNNSDDMTITKLSKEVGISNTSPYFYKVFKFLLNIKAITIKKGIGAAKIIYIDHKKLCNVLMDNETFEDFEEFIKHKNYFWQVYKL